ncbi:MAG: PhnD/SsuA/transferrin family substrate-binding protein [Chloroflexota bacterium]
MKRLLILFSVVIFGCSFPVRLTAATPTPTLTLTPAETPTATQPPPPTPQPGSEENPLILALAPSPRFSQEAVDAGNVLAAQLESLTGYHFVTVSPTSEIHLVDMFRQGNAHIASMSPYSYLLARREDLVTVGLASLHNEELFYGAQLIANRDSEFRSFFDKTRGENTAEADVALMQFRDKKPCWSDTVSPSGYVVPLGVLNQAGVQVRSGAFLEGQGSVVRAVYASDICDFGASFIDARTLPALELDYPDVMDRVRVIWRIPAVIPYENISFSTSVPLEVRRVLLRAFVDVMISEEGKATMRTVYGVEALQPAEDDVYLPFAEYVEASELDLQELLIGP